MHSAATPVLALGVPECTKAWGLPLGGGGALGWSRCLAARANMPGALTAIASKLLLAFVLYVASLATVKACRACLGLVTLSTEAAGNW